MTLEEGETKSPAPRTTIRDTLGQGTPGSHLEEEEEEEEEESLLLPPLLLPAAARGGTGQLRRTEEAEASTDKVLPLLCGPGSGSSPLSR